MDNHYRTPETTRKENRSFISCPRTPVRDKSGHLSRDIPDSHTAPPLGGRVCPESGPGLSAVG